MTRLTRALLALAILGVAHAATPRATQPRSFVLANARIVDGTGAPPIERGRVVIEGDRIARVGPMDGTAAPAGADTIDLSGQTILPGLIDLHFHVENDSKLALRQLRYGVTSFRDPGQWDEQYDELRRFIAADNLPGPRIFTTGPHIDGERPAYPADSVVARDVDEARVLAERAADRGATALKIYFRLPFASAKAVIDVCNRRKIPCTAHLEVLDARALFDAGLHGIEHITSLGTSILPQREAEAYRQSVLADNDARRDGRYALFARANLDGPEAKALYATLRAKRPWVDPTLAVFERRATPPADGKADAAQMKLIEMRAAGFLKMKQLTARAAREGARIVMGGHTSVPFAGRGEAPWRELELLVESGLSPIDAIAAATGTAAAFLYRGDRFGTLRAGLQADLVVTRGDPSRDIAAIRTVDRVMVAGKWIDIARYRDY
jgi:imidazolonepropionase-like amidohydrolase